MKIAFACEHCGKRYEVDSFRAGRRGKCSGCGGEMTVPDRPAPVAAEPLHDGYALGEEVDTGPSTYEPAPRNDDDLPPPRERKSRPSGVVKTMKQVRPGQFAHWRRPIIGVGVALAVMLVLALVFPKLALVLGAIIVVVGLVLAVGGFLVGAYAAFQEDFVFGVLYLALAPFTAWYLVSRFDELKAVAIAAFVGVALCLVGGWAMEYGYEPDVAAEPDVEVSVVEKPVNAPKPAPRAARPVR